MPSLENWLANGLRVTAFPITKKNIDELLGWHQILGVAPDDIKRQPKLNILEESGAFEKGLLSYKVVPGRVDWTYQPTLSEKILSEGLPSVGPFPEAKKVFLPIAFRWLEQCDSLSRIAFGASIILPTVTHAAAYELLGTYLHSVRVDPKSTELFYQINRIRSSKSHPREFDINRLSKWRALRFSMGVNDFKLEDTFACSLEIDINNVPLENLEIQQSEINNILSEFVSLGDEIIDKGDIP